MMLKTGENSDFWSPVDVSKFEDSDELSIDIESLFAILSEPPEDSPSRSEDTSCKNSSQGEATSAVVNHKRSSQPLDDIQESKQSSSTGVGLPESSLLYSSEYSTPSDSREGMGSDCWVECQENPGMIFDHGQPPHVDSCSASLVDWTTVSNTKYVPYYREGVHGSLSAPLYCNTDGKTIPNNMPTCRTTFNLKSETEDEEFRLISENCSTAIGSSTEGMGSLERSPCESLPNASNQLFDILHETGGYCRTVTGYGPFADSSRQFPSGTFNLPQKTSVGEEMNCAKDELFVSHIIGSSFKREASAHFSPSRTNSSHDADDGPLTDNKSKQLLCGIQSVGPCKKEVVCIDDARENELLASKTAYYHYHSVNAKDKAVRGYPPSVSGTSSCGSDSGPLTDCASRRLLLGNPSLTSSEKLTVKDERKDTYLPSWSVIYNSVKVTGEVVKDNSSVYRSHVVDDDDSDVCIIEDMSDPRYSPPIVAHGNSLVTSQHSAFGDPLYHTGARLKTNDERLTVQVLLQDLSQTKSEASPPDFLAVPLLRHQRIALSWMVQKETASFPCSGGILADDQGMGKTISVIALILKERPPLSKMSSIAVKQDESEALNLDEDDDDDSTVLQLDGMKQYRDFGNVTLNRSSMERENASMLAKGRPAAGTLVVCPTSVLRQWAEELCTKVMKEANLSILVYHGSGRTKDPFELAKYDVVLTTYAIVSQEVPKQPLVDKDDDEKGVSEDHGLGPMELSSSRKRKYPPSSDKKRKKGMDSVLLESAARPLARVGWFRVVLDEAQSIKNFKTQAARACWGLRAKRRWCLSGTPIQNAVDDLYSYFRFLRYDPYAVYKSFCYMIKVPINRNPTNGYRKLQAVLKTIMLRRTKGTRLDGEPIINLPPKTIELKKVDFSMEERDFYSKLEADSRAQFKVYAAAGTVKQNYVNILLMLLRLRQACDHPFLVKGYDSNSVWRSSIEMANKLPREQQIGLLNHLEASLEVCGICSDPPEDAVVTICGHVFCNQCICEHLTSDDNLCPATQCKGQLSVTSVFSRATLKSSLSDGTGQASSVVNSASHLVETLKPCSEGLSDSSKIKAALELLQSLSKPLDCTSKDSTLKSIAEVEIHTERGLDDSSKKLVDKAIVFSQWTRMLDLLEARLKNSSIQYRRLDGTMSVVARDKAVKDFNTLPEVTVMIMSLKAASLGLNMVAACHVLLLDLWWNPTTEDQAIDRAHRIGQTRPVTVLRLTVKDTVEDRILALQQKKREMVASAFGEDGSGSRQAHLTEDDLKYLFMV